MEDSTAIEDLVHPESTGIAERAFESCTAVVLDFLQSKGLFAAERALRTELEVNYHRSSHNKLIARNLWQSQIECMLEVKLPKTDGGARDVALLLSQVSSIQAGSATPTNAADEVTGGLVQEP